MTKIVTAEDQESVDENGLEKDRSLREGTDDETSVTSLEGLDRKEIISLVAKRLTQLPEVQKKVLAMLYYENIKLPEIAVAYEITTPRIWQIRSEALTSVNRYLLSMLPRAVWRAYLDVEVEPKITGA
jgi:RNA polymerase sigma factor for flagellar operon FliA